MMVAIYVGIAYTWMIHRPHQSHAGQALKWHSKAGCAPIVLPSQVRGVMHAICAVLKTTGVP